MATPTKVKTQEKTSIKVAGPARTKKGSEATSSGILQQISQITKANVSNAETFRQVFRAIAKHFASSYGLVYVRAGANVLQDSYEGNDRCPEDLLAVADAMVIEAEAEAKANVRLFAQQEAQTIAVLSAPIYTGSNQAGTMCIATRVKANKDARILLSELIALLAFTGSQFGGGTVQDASGSSKIFEKVLKYESVTEFAYSLTNTLATRFGCEQVAFGKMQNKQAKLLAISGLDRFSRSSNGVVTIQQAMEECSDAARIIHYQFSLPNDLTNSERSFMLHRQWHQAANNASLLSLPIKLEGEEPFAVVSLMREAARPFSPEEIESIQSLMVPLAPALKLLERGSRGLVARLGDNIQRAKRFLSEPGQSGRKLAFAALIASLLFFFLGWMPHNVVVPCRIQPSNINHISMPFGGTIKEVLVRDGQQVSAGQTLARLDVRPLQLEQDRLQSQMASFRIDMDRGLSERNVAEAALAATNLETAQIQLKLVEDRRAKANIVAPVDGVVLRGELDQRVGQLLKMGDPLLEIGRMDEVDVELDIPETIAHFVEVGDIGKFSSFARPGKRVEFEISQLAGLSMVKNDKNVFVADGRLDSAPTWMRAGMEGTAKVKTGWRPAWWVLTHGLIDRVRMALWM